MKEQKVWLVTDADSGIGLALVKMLLWDGYKVAATSRTINKLQLNISENKNFLPMSVDLTVEACVEEALEKVIKKFGRLDMVVNTAGNIAVECVEEISNWELRQAMDINTFGTVNLIRAVMPSLRNEQSGHIFNFLPFVGYHGTVEAGSYSAIKPTVVSYSETLAEEVKPLGIKVTIVETDYLSDSFTYRDSLQDNFDKLAAAFLDAAESDDPPAYLLLDDVRMVSPSVG